MPLYSLSPDKILFLDIETVSAQPDFSNLNEDWQSLWDQKTRFLRRDDQTLDEVYEQRAAIMAEFGKIVCISCGFFNQRNGHRSFRVKSFYGDDEAELLQGFADLLNGAFSKDYLLCAHNGKEFDFPYIARRMVVHGIRLPALLNTSGLKPWEVRHLDTMEMWKFGDYKHFTSVKLLAALFHIPTPKDDIDGSMVGEVYWKEKNLQRIVTYCQKDTVTVARIFLKMEGREALLDEEIVISNE
ncbi:MAG TPA: 3'-5' exonuclease [Cryomorphaceae bacterium]|nr:3'-5' exonuclease [Owenweeksia sp.]MBF99150.1 3'-5' exonuclease [Owenweeksia sp.]HAD98550.1 3'-5' exonuclease [Cryomorphaceae bacterium]HBF20626.1 3'-5' exonuclease [Cryomorphaceae bacterium]HCQ16897.1 3'-5' exonuclease [Cryomorphaceae bacterium]|tara:strand:+ start:13461 stop:14186 length:726 start_codon:yes stop_codon:yes gene_type:complete